MTKTNIKNHLKFHHPEIIKDLQFLHESRLVFVKLLNSLGKNKLYQFLPPEGRWFAG